MKKFYAILCLAIASLTQLQAQAPQGFNYQATVRNSVGDLIVNTNVYFKFNVIQGSNTAVPIFTETHYVPTDDLGQVNLVIGQGTANTGVFSELDWSLGSYYLGIELDTGNGYVAMGTTQLLSVPYALYAENSGNAPPTTPNLEVVIAENNSANNQQIKDLQDPTDAQDAVTKAYVDTEVLNNVQNIEQVLTQGNDANGIQLKGIADPTEAQDAVTKNYADNIISSFGYQQWSNNQVWNDNTTISPEPNSFWFINADNTTITLPPLSNQGDVIKIYYMGAGLNNFNEDGHTTFIDAQTNNLIVGFKSFDLENYYNSGFGYFSGAIKPFKLQYGLNELVQIGDYWMLGEIEGFFDDFDFDNDGYSVNQGDCDDANAQVNPGATEIEDGIDNDCDGEIDEGFNTDTPIIQSVSINQESATGGTNVIFSIVVESNAPVDFLNSSFNGPNGNIFGGGVGTTFTETSSGIWEYTTTYFVSEWAPSGLYYFSNISVENEGELQSAVWPNEVATTITNPETAMTPIIQSVSINQESATGGTNVIFSIVVESNAPVDFLNSSFNGPNGNIFGGGVGTTFTETSSGIWEYTTTYFVSEWAPSGLYYFSNISVENEGELQSAVWPNEVATTITN